MIDRCGRSGSGSESRGDDGGDPGAGGDGLSRDITPHAPPATPGDRYPLDDTASAALDE